MALLSEELPLTSSCLSPLPWFSSLLGHVRKLPMSKSVVSLCYFPDTTISPPLATAFYPRIVNKTLPIVDYNYLIGMCYVNNIKAQIMEAATSNIFVYFEIFVTFVDILYLLRGYN